jgi:predicted secreted protein
MNREPPHPIWCRTVQLRHSRFGTLALLLAVAPVLLAACGSADDEARTIGDADNGATVELKIGERLEVALSGNPTTGYNWEVQPLDTPVLQQVGERDFEPDDPDADGSGGTVTVRFDAIAAGQTALRLEYRRPWDDPNAPPHESYVVTVVVTE